MPDGTSTAHLFHPKLLTMITQGCELGDLQRDAIAGLKSAVVASSGKWLLSLRSDMKQDDRIDIGGADPHRVKIRGAVAPVSAAGAQVSVMSRPQH